MYINFATKTDSDVVAMALGVRPGTISVNSVMQVLEAPEHLYGVGDKRSQQLKAVAELAKRIIIHSNTKKVTAANTPEDVYDYVAPHFQFLKKEHFAVLLLNTKNQIIGMPTISIGSLSASIVHPREVFKEAIEASAASIILLHNHPSGDPSPSREDISVTERMIKTGKIMDIPVLDHIIIGDNRFCSLKERGLII